MHETKWHLVYTRPGEENKVACLLTKKGILNYCPLNKSNQRWRERRHIDYRPLFPGYVFVCLNNTNPSCVKSLPGVINFIFWLGELAVIPGEEILAIRDFLAEYSGIKLDKTPVDREAHVRVIYGPLVVREGEEFEVRNSPVGVILPSMGYILIAQERKRSATVNFNLQEKFGIQHKKVS